MKILKPAIVFAAAVLALTACSPKDPHSDPTASKSDGMVGAWRSHISFNSGAFAAVKDLEFMYVFNQGGTLTESSNYDGSPPVPPAYGVWRSTGPREFEAKYLFYITAPPKKLEDLGTGGGWGPAGYGVFVENITVAADGKSFTSTIDYTAFDPQGKAVEGGGKAEGSGNRIAF